MTLFFLLLLDPSSFLHPRRPGCAVPGDHAPCASCATAIPDRGPLFVSDDPAEEAECGESAALWGLRDSGPYLHDGRAKTLDEAVMWHGGQGAESARQFQALTRVERLQVQAFQKTLVAPASDGSPEASLADEEDARGAEGASAAPGRGGEPPADVQSVRRRGCFCNAQSLDWV